MTNRVRDRQRTIGIGVLLAIVSVGVTAWIYFAVAPNFSGPRRRASERATAELDQTPGSRRSADVRHPRKGKDAMPYDLLRGPAAEGAAAGNLPVEASRDVSHDGLVLLALVRAGRPERLSKGSITYMACTTPGPHIIVRWSGRLPKSHVESLELRMPDLAVTRRKSGETPVSTRLFDGPRMDTKPVGSSGDVEVELEWLFSIVGIDTLSDAIESSVALRLVANLGKLRTSGRLTLTTGILPTSLNVSDSVDAAGLVSIVAIIHIVAVDGLADAKFEIRSGADRIELPIKSCYLEGKTLDLPCAVTRFLDDSYLEVRAALNRGSIDFGNAVAQVTVWSNKGTAHAAAWRIPGE